MRAAMIIAWREYKQYILSRGFLLFLVMFPLGVLLGGAAVGFAQTAQPARHFVVIDETGLYAEAIDREIELNRMRNALVAWNAYVKIAVREEALDGDQLPEPFGDDPVSLARVEAFIAAGGVEAGREAIAPYLREGAPPFVALKQSLIRVAAPPELETVTDLTEAANLLRPYLLGEKKIASESGEPVDLFAALLIPENFGAENNGGAPVDVEYWSRNLTDDTLSNAVGRALDLTLRRQKIAELGLSEAVLDDIRDTQASITQFRPDRAEDDAELGLQDRIEIFLPAALTYMLVVVIFGVGNLLLTNTIEERSNKIVEVLLSSVTAEELMIGKLIGIGAVGLTLPTVFLVGGGLAAFVAPGGAEFMGGILSTLFSTNLFVIYLFYFLCAYSIFAMIFLAIGAISNSLQDAQSYMGPVTLLVFAPLPFVMMMYQNPNGLIASVLTWIPIYTPYAVLMRAASGPPLWEIVGATALMVVFAWFLAKIMGRIFRRALLQSAPPKAKDVLKLATRRAD